MCKSCIKHVTSLGCPRHPTRFESGTRQLPCDWGYFLCYVLQLLLQLFAPTTVLAKNTPSQGIQLGLTILAKNTPSQGIQLTVLAKNTASQGIQLGLTLLASKASFNRRPTLGLIV